MLAVLLLPATVSASELPDFDPDVLAIIDRLTLEEKVGQMTNLTLATVAVENDERTPVLDDDKMHEVFVKHHVGSIQNVISGAYTIEQWRALVQQLQDYVLENSSHKIPNLYSIDSVHGANYVLGATQFPHNLGIAATRNADLASRVAAITAAETRAAGIRQNFSPVLDVGRNQQWSRLGETFGEDTLVGTVLGVAMVRGYEGESQLTSPKVASSLKHYIGYSEPTNGRDRAPAYIPEIVLREYHLPQFREAVKAGAASVMVNSGEVNGVPLHASRYFLTDVLREELGFEGLLMSDWQDIQKLHERHRVAESYKEAVFLAIDAGIDMVIVPMDFRFTESLVELVQEGRISERRIDASVARILTLKKKVGLFENPNVESQFADYFRKPEYRDVALQAAKESLVLLKNEDGLLPLAEDTKVLLTGPTAALASALHGAWSYSWQGDKEELYPERIKSLRDAFSSATYLPVPNPRNPDDRESMLVAARDHDVVLVALGEESYAETPGNVPDLALAPEQVELVGHLATSGKPVVVVLLQGRPRIIREIEPLIDGLIVGFWPGSQGADAIHDVIFGDYNPSGRLPVTYPRFSGTLLTYDHKLLDEAVEIADPYEYKYVFDPQFEFGDGLSYTSFAYENLTATADAGSGSLLISVDVQNTGQAIGQEVVELYVRDLFASVTPSVKRLRGFEKIELRPGESQTVTFRLEQEDLSFVNAELAVVFESGEFEIQIGDKKTTVLWE